MYEVIHHKTGAGFMRAGNKRIVSHLTQKLIVCQ